METDKENANHGKTKGRPRNGETATSSLVEVLNLVRLGHATTRQELERVGEYGRAIIADRLLTLKDLGLVDESETGVATGGRAPRLVRLMQDKGRLAVVTLDQSAVGVGFADLSGKLISEHHEIIDITNQTVTVERVCALINWMLSRQTVQADFWGISISVPGPVIANPSSSFLTQTPDFLPNWDKSKLIEELTSRFKAPVWMHSNVETMTMGELHGGAGIDQQSMLFVKVGQRIGASLVNEGEAYHGAAGAVGLIGHLPVTYNGNTGTLDAMAGAEMIKTRGIAAAESGESDQLSSILSREGGLTEIDVCQAAQMGDKISTDIIVQSGRLIGGVLATLTNMLNPQLIVLAGSIAQTNDILLASVREAVYGASHPLVTRDLRILRSQMSGSAALLGAATIGVEALFAPSFLKDWIILGTPTEHPDFKSKMEIHDNKVTHSVDAPPPPPNIGRRHV